MPSITTKPDLLENRNEKFVYFVQLETDETPNATKPEGGIFIAFPRLKST